MNANNNGYVLYNILCCVRINHRLVASGVNNTTGDIRWIITADSQGGCNLQRLHLTSAASNTSYHSQSRI